MTRARFLMPVIPAVIVWAAYLVAVFLTEFDVAGTSDFANLTKLLLMPALLVGFLWALPTLRSQIALFGSLGIVFSWLGDALLASPGGEGFLLGLGSFFLAHVAYLFLFIRALRVRRLPRIAAVYLLWWVVFVTLLAPHAGALLVPIAAYGLVLGAVAAWALTANRLVAVGAVLFLVSDSILGLRMFVPDFDFWQIDFAIMVAYLLGQGLIAAGAVVHARASTVPAPALEQSVAR